MKEILKKKERKCVNKEEFCYDMEVFFDELKNSYGAYDYFGEEAFLNAKQAILEKANSEYEFERLEAFLIEEFSKFIKDGHFSINGKNVFIAPREKIYQDENKNHDYAVKIYEVEGIPVFDIKKFYNDTDEELEQLETFAKSGENYKDVPCLIFDLRQNRGGSDTYLYDFLTGLNGEEPDFPIDFRQIYSDTFVEWLANECDMHGFEQGIEEEKSNGKILETKQKIYVLIDRRVASSGESAVANLKTMSSTMVLGENTNGCFFCGNCIHIYLPHSGICVYYGTGRLLYNGTQNIDELGGFAPDIYGAFEVEDVVRMYLKEGTSQPVGRKPEFEEAKRPMDVVRFAK